MDAGAASLNAAGRDVARHGSVRGGVARGRVASGWRSLLLTSCLAALVAVAPGCAAPAGANLGSLAITVTAPSGVAAGIEVTGPGGYHSVVSATRTLSGLAPGAYQLTAPAARLPGTLVDELYDGTVVGGGTVQVSAGVTATETVSYLLRPGTGALWVAVHGRSKIAAFGATQLPSGGEGVTPARALGLGASQGPYALAFDADGDAWVGTQAGYLIEYAVTDLGASGTPSPAVVIDTGSTDVNGIAFDASGMLWATIAGGIAGYAPSQLASSGSPVPAVKILGTASHALPYPQALTFDVGGGLWVAANTFVARYSPAQLLTGGALDPDVVVGSNGTSLQTARGLAFDAAGALWVASWSSGAVEKFRPQDIVSSGAPDPTVRLTGIGVSPLRLAFDNAGNLWVTSSYDPGWTLAGHIGMVEAANLVASGSPGLGASFTNVGGFDSGGTLAFAPPAPGLVGAP